MTTAEYTRFKAELAAASAIETSSAISLEIVLTNGKSYSVSAKDDKTFVSTPHVSDNCLVVMGAGEVYGSAKSKTTDAVTYNGNYTKLIFPLEMVSYILIHYVDDVVKTIEKDITDNEETVSDDTTATE